MRTLLSVLLAFMPGVALAQSGNYSQSVQEVAEKDGVIQTISLCDTNSPRDVTNATSSGTLSGAFAVEVYNVAAATATINCGFDRSVSTNVTSALYGREIPAGVGVVFQIRQTGATETGVAKKLWCGTQLSPGCTRATITQLK